MDSGASPIAFLALLLVAPLTIVAFSVLSTQRAVLVTLFGSLLFLPEKVFFDAPGMPPLSKQSIPALCVLVGVLVVARKEVKSAAITRFEWFLMVCLVLAPIGTVLTNRDSLVYGRRVIQGLGTNDVISLMVHSLLTSIVPFFLGRALFRTAEHAKDILRTFAYAGLVYVPFVLVELRLSPQWHYWVYGYLQHSFVQTVRWGGYRPMCFMSHGLSLAFLWGMAVFSAWTLSRLRKPIAGVNASIPAAVLTILFPFLKSVAAMIYTAFLIPVSRFLKPKSQARLAAILACIVLAYPLMRATGTFPREAIYAFAADANQERADSLEYRFMNEEQLLTKALERPWFGWGGWSRNRVFNEWGDDISIVDGEWVAMFGGGGFVTFFVTFGLLLLPVGVALRRMDRVPQVDQPLLAALTLMATVHAVDLLPNAMYGRVGIFLSGAVAGIARGMSHSTTRQVDLAQLARWLIAIRRVTAIVRARSARYPL